MNKKELEEIARTNDFRGLIDIYYRINYMIPKIKKEIETNPKKTYTKNQVLNILYIIKNHKQRFIIYNELTDDTKEGTN